MLLCPGKGQCQQTNSGKSCSYVVSSCLGEGRAQNKAWDSLSLYLLGVLLSWEMAPFEAWFLRVWTEEKEEEEEEGRGREGGATITTRPPALCGDPSLPLLWPPPCLPLEKHISNLSVIQHPFLPFPLGDPFWCRRWCYFFEGLDMSELLTPEFLLFLKLPCEEERKGSGYSDPGAFDSHGECVGVCVYLHTDTRS